MLGLFSKNVTSVEVLGVGDKAILDSVLHQVLYVALWEKGGVFGGGEVL